MMAKSFATVSSQLDYHSSLLIAGAPPALGPTEYKGELISNQQPPSYLRCRSIASQDATSYRNTIGDGVGNPSVSDLDPDPRLWLSELAVDEHPNTNSSSRTTQSPGSGLQSNITITSTLKPACPPNCRCQCHATSHVRSPAWVKTALGSLMVDYRSLPLVGLSRCNMPLCKSVSGTSLRIQYCFPRWAVARAVQMSMSWDSLNDNGASIFIKIPRIINGLEWLNSIYQPDSVALEMVRQGKVRPTDVLVESGQTALTVPYRP